MIMVPLAHLTVRAQKSAGDDVSDAA